MRLTACLSAAATMLLICGAVMGESHDGTTPLHWAVHNNDAAGVDKLIKGGANVNAKNDFGSTPLIEAAMNGNTAAGTATARNRRVSRRRPRRAVHQPHAARSSSPRLSGPAGSS